MNEKRRSLPICDGASVPATVSPRCLAFATASPLGLRCDAIASLAILTVVATALLCFSCIAQAKPPAADPKSADDRKRDQLIDAIANRNEPPRLADDNGATHPPLFAANYDWTEQDRVIKAIDVLVREKNKSDDLWSRLAEHIDDKRYALTYEFNDGVGDRTVGEICRNIAYADLMKPFGFLWPNNIDIPNVISVNDKFFRPPPCRDLKGWCHARQGKPLWELQVEIGEWGIKTMEGLAELDKDKKALAIQKSKETIDTLRRTKKPIVNEHWRHETKFFNAQEAMDIREKYLTRVSIGLGPKPDSTNEPTYLQRTLSEWFVLAKNKDSRVRVYAAQALGDLGEMPVPDAKSAVPTLIELLKDADSTVRQAAAVALETLYEKAKPAIPALKEAVNDKASKVRAAAVSALWIIQGLDAKSAVPVLLQLLKDKDSSVRCTAAVVLRRIGPKAKSAIPALTELLKDKDSEVRWNAIIAFTMVSSDAKSAAPVLAQLLKDESEQVRDAAGIALDGMGSDAKSAVPVLKELLKDKDEKVRQAASHALKKIEGKKSGGNEGR
jgi:hypothetical protein